MKRKGWLSKIFLLPVSKIYGMCTYVRNWMFDVNLLKSKEFDVPVIVVGNLAVGGTGKTPHVEFIVEQLRHSFHMAVLSRGYKRETSGFVMATKRSTPADIGDEPYQIYHKFDCEVAVAVCEDRVAGISELLTIDPQIDLVLLDDAFQHRYVKPAISILLTEYQRPFFTDSLLPYGNLREAKRGAERADIVVATKCPERVNAIDFRIFEQNVGVGAWQKMFFSRISYCMPVPIFPDSARGPHPSLEWMTEDDMILAVAGVGNPKPFIRYVKRFKPGVRVNLFPDHHNFSKRDMATILKRFETMEGNRRYLITTEKDAVRMANCPYFPHQLKPYAYYLPIRVDFVRDGNSAFVDHLRKLIRLSKLSSKYE